MLETCAELGTRTDKGSVLQHGDAPWDIHLDTTSITHHPYLPHTYREGRVDRPVDFAAVHAAELERIGSWRSPSTRNSDENDQATDGNDASVTPRMSSVDLVTSGLALSGGGIRSAAFCMGVLQALHCRGVMDKFDYLSSVSGGGYVAATLQSWKLGGGSFPFALPGAPSSDLRDAPAVQHIRDHSRYLMPRGMRDLVDSIAVVLRGLVASASLVVSPMLLLASMTVALNPDRSALDAPHFALVPVGVPWPEGWIGTTSVLIGATGLLFGWALNRSFRNDEGGAEFKEGWSALARWTLLVLVAVAFLEVQPRLVAGFVALAHEGGDGHPAQGFGLAVLDWIKHAAALLAPVAGLASLVVRQIQTVARTKASDPTWSGMAARIVAQVLLLALAAALPLLLWVSYLYLVFWGIECGSPGALTFAPGWLGSVASILASGSAGTALLYGIVGAFLLAASWSLSPNANSLHRLYRDRLAQAFIIGPPRTGEGMPGSDEVNVATPPRLSEIGRQRPYPLINVALNIQGSSAVNKRGRNADFFLLSPLFSGSASTGYAATKDIEGLDLAAAIAISGAAASPDMGSRTMRVLTPTLAILNVRLGYWMRNPRPVDTGKHVPGLFARGKEKLYLLKEMLGLLDERSPHVYLTDGGHIENLGIYELLRRRCGLIVAVDAEADPEMSFSSFVALQRYARIDLGIRIELPWDAIRQRTRATSEQVRALSAGGPAIERCPGPHAVEGRILYPGGEVGQLLYVKSSMSGDENDYILDYKARNPAFPHEATADQFFSEEQFEAYRALGFHAAFDALDGIDLRMKAACGTSCSQDPPGVPDQSGREAEEAVDRFRNRAVPQPS